MSARRPTVRMPQSDPASFATMALRQHFWGYAAVIAVVQGAALVLVMPALARLFDAALRLSDVAAINLDSLSGVVTDPVAVGLLVGFALLSAAVVFVELSVLTVCAHRHFDGDPVTLRSVGRDLLSAFRRLLGPQVLLLVVYVFLLLPLAGIGVTSVVTKDIAVPAFISGELTKTTTGSIAWWGGTALLVYLALRLVLTLPMFLGTDRSLFRAMRDSARATGWLPWRPALAIAARGLVVLVLLALLGALAVGLTALATGPLGGSTTWWPAFSLALVELGRFVLVGLAAAWVTLFGVAWTRQVDHEAQVPLARLPMSSRRFLAAALVTTGVVALVPLTRSDAAVVRLERDPGETLVIAHRGYVGGGVENSIEALDAAAEAGADLVEMDVVETADEQLLVTHDANLGRLAGEDVDVADTDLDDLVGTTVRQDGFTSELVSFETYAARARALGVRLLVELKPTGSEGPGFAERVVDTFDRLGLPADWQIQSLDKGLVEEIEDRDPALDVGYVVPFNVGRLPETTADFVVVEDWSWSRSLAEQGQAQGTPVYVWTVNDGGLIRSYLRRGVDGMITDRVPSAVTSRELVGALTNPVSVLLDGLREQLGPRT